MGIGMISDKLLKLLLLIKSAGKIEGKTKIQKMVFLGKEEEELNLGFDFVKYNYGPYSFELAKALNALEDGGLIKINMSLVSSPDEENVETKRFTFSLTEEGNQLISERQGIPEEVKNKIERLVKRWNNVPGSEIIRHVYSNYM